jgi:histidine phosphotransferase ChpT
MAHDAPPLTSLHLAELLTARLCHELTGPVGAIGNGIEVLGEDDSEFQRDAVALIGDSARRAATRLQFYRFAYGFGGGTRAGPPPAELATALFEDTRIECDYRGPPDPDSAQWHKLGCNLLVAAAEGLPRGGRLSLRPGAAGPEVEAEGEGAALPPHTRAGLLLETPPEAVTTRTVHAWFTGLLAADRGFRVTIEDAAPGRFLLLAAVR